MPEIVLKGPAIIRGAVRYPVEGPILVSEAVAENLLDQGVLDEEASFDDEDIASLSVPALKQIAADEGVDLAGLSKKDDIVAAVRAHRAAA